MAVIIPNTIIIGAQKSGTTTVFEWLRQHPDVYGTPTLKDFPFFTDEVFYSKGTDWFARQFGDIGDQSVILHGYAHYLFRSELAAVRIAQFNPKTKVICLLRNPVDRAFSAFLQARKVGLEDLDSLEEGFKREHNGTYTSERQSIECAYLANGLYANNIEVYRNQLGDEQLFIGLFDDLIGNPDRLYGSLIEFLGLKTAFSPDKVKENVYGEARNLRLQKLIRAIRLPDPVKSLLPLRLRIAAKKGLIKLNTRHTEKPEMSEDTQHYLQDYYAEEIQQLENLLGRNLSAWRDN